MKSSEKIIWNIFYVEMLIIFFYVIAKLTGVDLNSVTWFKILFLVVPVILLITHSFYTLTPPRALFFMLLASCIGFIAEYFGLKNGTIFGGQYVYHSNQFSVMTVPLSVILYWAVFIYTGYCIITSYFCWLHKEKPNRKINFLFLPIAIVLDGITVTAIDLFMDPIQVKTGGWLWLHGGPYFGVPIGNFIGWFLVTMLVTGIFRTIEYFFPIRNASIPKSVFLVPTVSYCVMAISYCISAVEERMYGLVIIGSLCMLPIGLTNIYLFIKWKNSTVRKLTL